MGEFKLKNPMFITSVGNGGDGYPAPAMAEIAMVGRSNVGKSSLINSLCNNFRLARTSQHPGKTRLINFFSVNNDYYLVDLPGYGFAKAPKSEKAQWGRLIENYLSSGRVTHIFLLLDIRHEPTAEDRQMLQWILYYGIPFTIVATKADKIAVSKRQQAANKVAKLAGAPPYAIAYSAESGQGRPELLIRIGDVFSDAHEGRGSDEANTDYND